NPAARRADAAFTRRSLSRLPIAHLGILSVASSEGNSHMSFVSTIVDTAERVPLPDVIIRAAIHQLCSRTAAKFATGNAESDAWFADEMAARAIAEHAA